MPAARQCDGCAAQRRVVTGVEEGAGVTLVKGLSFPKVAGHVAHCPFAHCPVTLILQLGPQMMA